MKKLTFMIVIICTSYTCVSLAFALFSEFDLAPALTNEIGWQIFCICCTIAFLMLLEDKLTDLLNLSSLLADGLIRLLVCYVVVFIEGSFFKMFSFSPDSLLRITPILIPVYLLTYAAGYFSCLQYANTINRSIKKNGL